MDLRPFHSRDSQRGVAAVEFAIVAVLLFTLLFGIIEFGRLFFTINSMQEITRRAAREQVVRLTSQPGTAQCLAVLRQPGCGNTANFPGVGDVAKADVRISFYSTYLNAVSGTDPITGNFSPSENINNCMNNESDCIRFVRATLRSTSNTTTPTPLDFNVIAPYIPSGMFSLPVSTVIMPAEALGLL